MRKIVVVLLLAWSASAADSNWRTYAGGYSTSWKTIGPHGHDQPCAIMQVGGAVLYPDGSSQLMLFPNCDDDDFARGNLDNSIGFRFGRERDFLALGAIRVAGGYESNVSDTEYNISQRDLAIIGGAFTGGVDVARWGARLGVRYGVGAFITTNVHYGLHSFKEIGLTLPLGNGSALRITRGTAVNSHTSNHKFRLAGFSENVDNATAKEFGLLLITQPGAGPAHWDFAATSGVSMPRDLNLSRAGYYRLTVLRDLGSSPLQLQFSWTSAAHESKLEGIFNGYPKNLRSKTIDSYGVGVRFHRDLWRGLSAHVTAGGEIAEWTDPHGLLVDENHHVVDAGIEAAANAGIGVRWMFTHGIGIEAMTEAAYWPSLGLNERRTGIGLVVHR